MSDTDDKEFGNVPIVGQGLKNRPIKVMGNNLMGKSDKADPGDGSEEKAI
jgi:hypothetical protein